MKRFFHLLNGDMLQQYKYGFYLLYLFITLLYIIALSLFPQEWVNTIGLILVISDPMLLGYVFIGAIVLFERSERVTNALSVMPIKANEYLFSKLLSLGSISLVSSLLIAFAGGLSFNFLRFSGAVLLGSFLFTQIGIIQVFHSSSLNGFLTRLIPTMFFIIIPPLLYFFGIDSWWQYLMPGTVVIKIISNGGSSLFCWLILLLYFCLSNILVQKTLKKLFSYV